MKLGTFTVVLGDMALDDACGFLESNGVQMVEIGCGGFPGKAHCDAAELLADEKKQKKFLDTIHKHHLEISALSSHGNMVHPVAEIAKKFDDDLTNAILLAEKLGVPVVNTFSGCPGGSAADKTPNWVTCPWPDDFSETLEYQWNEVLIPYWKKKVAFAKEHGGGMVLDWGVHLLDQALMLFPGVALKTIYATLTNVTNQLVDDGFTADLGFANGVHMIVEVGTSNFISLPRWYVLGTNGTAMIQDWGGNLKIVRARGVDKEDVVPVRTAAGLTKTMAPRREDSIFTEERPEEKSDICEFYQNVMAVIEGREESRIKLEEVARVMRVMEAVFASAQNNQVIAFEK